MRQWIKLLETNGDSYFSASAWEHANELCSGNSRYTLIHMSPDDFLKMARQGHDEIKSAKVDHLAATNVKFNDIPFLQFQHDGDGTAQVVGHEGRHRARALKALGITSIPVVFMHVYDGNGQSMRWNAMNAPEDRDFFRDDWPQRLYSEDQRGVYIPFPVDDPRPEGHKTVDHPLSRPLPVPDRIPPIPVPLKADAKRRAKEKEETDELLRQLGEGKEVFMNELDHEITVEIEPRDTDGVDGIWIDMIGPDSEAENHITRMEAEVMYRLLGAALKDVENRVCKTPGADYQTRISDDEVGITVKLPPEVEVPDMPDDKAQEYEDMMHDAMEEVLAKMLADLDADAEEHWDEARKNDPQNT